MREGSEGEDDIKIESEWNGWMNDNERERLS